MKSVKPGRGPSMMGGIMSVAVGLIGVVWTVSAVCMGAGGDFAIFGLVFVGVAAVQAVYQFRNATSKHRYSEFDITDGCEEPDPLNEHFGGQESVQAKGSAFCPYCGQGVQEDYDYCNRCGKKLP